MELFKNMSPENCMDRVKQRANECIEKILKEKITKTKSGSIAHLLWGEQPSAQSICIKMGKVGEEIFKELINIAPNCELLKCGVQVIEGKKKKDVDLIWLDRSKNTIFIRELKGNIELDTEKLPATFEKMKGEIYKHFTDIYADKIIDCAILNWSVYSREGVKALSHIKTCEDAGVPVNHTNDVLKLIEIEWSEEDYYQFWNEIGDKLKDYINN